MPTKNQYWQMVPPNVLTLNTTSWCKIQTQQLECTLRGVFQVILTTFSRVIHVAKKEYCIPWKETCTLKIIYVEMPKTNYKKQTNKQTYQESMPKSMAKESTL